MGTLKKPCFELLREKEVHSRGVKAIEVWPTLGSCPQSSKLNYSSRRNPFVATGSYDGAIKIWSYNNLDHITTFTHHSDGVWDVKTHKNVLATCGTDGKVAVIEYELKPEATSARDR